MSKKIVLTGGGTMGHVTPNLALLPHLLEKGYEVHYIGTEKGVEADKLQAIEGITHHAVKSGKLRRYFDWKNFRSLPGAGGRIPVCPPDGQDQARCLLLQGRLCGSACGVRRVAAPHPRGLP